MRNPGRETTFRFKQFDVVNTLSAMKVGTDGVLLGAWAMSDLPADAAVSILDVGTGSGVIALMLAQRFSAARITGLEIDADACGEAAGNFCRSPWPDRLDAVRGDFSNPCAVSRKFNFIVSNPPFYSDGLKAPDNARSMARHDGALSLDMLMRQAFRALYDDGRLSLVLPAERVDDLRYLATLNGFTLSRITNVRTVQRKPFRRILAELTKGATSGSGGCDESTLMIYESPGTFSREYKELLADFYLNF